jgi:hypothetical protein
LRGYMTVDFGRVPVQTIAALEMCIRDVQEHVLSAVGDDANAEIRSFTLEKCLEFVLRDWRENDNTSGLEPADIADLRSFILTSKQLAGIDGLEGSPTNLDSSQFVVYKATLESLLDDWLHNWNVGCDA